MRVSQAQVARLKALESASGRLTAPKVVKDAKRPDSPLHSLFDWRVRESAEKWWLQRARTIIASVTYKTTHLTCRLEVPYWIQDPDAGAGGGYRSVLALKQDTPAARESLLITLRTAHGHLQRAVELAGPLGLQDEIDKLIAHVVRVKLLAGDPVE